MRPLVAVRSAAPFRPDLLGDAFARVAEEEPLLSPLERAATALSGYRDFPPVSALGQVFAGPPPVRFVAAAPRRRRGAPVDARTLYDARITLDREVPTRERCWHDLMNALVWGTFPRAKAALHARQHRAIAERLAPDTLRLPPTRTPELDALAILDEGGVVLWSRGAEDEAEARPIVFGHAIYESLVLGVAPAVVAGIFLVANPADLPAESAGVHSHARDRAPLESALLAAVDRRLCAAIEDETRLQTPGELRRLHLASPARRAPDGRYCAP